jgi:hypothetical protein
MGWWDQNGLRKADWEGTEWIHLAQDTDQWWALVNRMMNLWVLAAQSWLIFLFFMQLPHSCFTLYKELLSCVFFKDLLSSVSSFTHCLHRKNLATLNVRTLLTKGLFWITVFRYISSSYAWTPQATTFSILCDRMQCYKDRGTYNIYKTWSPSVYK